MKDKFVVIWKGVDEDFIEELGSKWYNELVKIPKGIHAIPLRGKLVVEGKKPEEVFGKNGKYAIKEFFGKIYSMSDECKQEIEEKAYKAACDHIKAFKSEGTASIVRKKLGR